MSSIDHADDLARRRVPCMVAFLAPFRIVDAPDLPEWTVSIKQVNTRGWDYVALHQIAGGIDVGLTAPYHMIVGRDGGLALPVLPELRSQEKAVGFFNHCLSALLLGGVYCTAVDLDVIDFGSIIDWKYVRVGTSASANQFHRACRMRHASPADAIRLMSPRTVRMSVLTDAMQQGRQVLETVPELSGEFLLRGTTGIARRDWSLALANLWIVIEQLSSNLWERHIITPAKAGDRVDGRIDQLGDTRTWTASARQEILFQLRIISTDVLRDLSAARKARNALSHTGKGPARESAQAALRAALQLLKIASGQTAIPIEQLNLADHMLSDPFLPTDNRIVEPQFWMAIPKLPGEAELERLEATLRKTGAKG